MKIRKRVIWWAKFKDFFTTKVPSLPMCPAPCPYCGAVVQVPLSRWVMENTCEVCESVYYSIGVGIVDGDKERLQFVHSEVNKQVAISSDNYRSKSLQ